jgi:hypothetical protein
MWASRATPASRADVFATIKNVRCVLVGGTDVVEATFKLDKLLEDPTFKEAIVKIQRWLATLT